ncbi:MAG: DUF1311 domain-containing protein [Saprospiraceae bacterium]|nr:DUF1311 domain-containing protein [Saprospiraceae bacterium]
MKFFVLLLLICYGFPILAQIDNENPPWELEAGEASTQAEMNRLSFSEGAIADSVMNVLYAEIIKIANENLQNQKVENSDDANFTRNRRRLKKAIIIGQKQFLKYRKQLTAVPNLAYEGGSIRPYAVNLVYKDATVGRIKLLQSYMDEYFEK